MTPNDPSRQTGPQGVSDTPVRVKRTLRGLYLFAGTKRRADIRHYLQQLCRKESLNLGMVELDVLRRRMHDLSQAQRRAYYVSCARRGKYDIILAPPPCGTFTRARWANKDGPKPVRLRH